MSQLFYPIFNTILGIIFLLIGFEKYQPFSPKKKENIMKTFGLFFKVAGAILIIGGLLGIFRT